VAAQCAVLGFGAAGLTVVAADVQEARAPLTVHEWGTCTTVAGPDGQAQEWLPLGGPTDLPCFVETYDNRLFKFIPGAQAGALGPLLNYDAARKGLRGTVRMETPVLYFYADRAMDVSVSVSFPRGLFTEWYPEAKVVQQPSWANVLKMSPNGKATMTWPAVSIRPGTRPVLPEEDAPSHYYEARRTDAAHVQVNGQDEKFLFYRGVGGFGVPLAAMPAKGHQLIVRNVSTDPIPHVLVFTNRGGKIGYRLERDLTGERLIDLPALTFTMQDLRRDLIAILVAEGLYRREADAMINTWRDTWFEEGTRVLYIVPKPAVEAMLPLQISPAPVAIARVFVGRMDVITADHLADVRQAMASNDQAALARHGRLLSVFGERILATTTAPVEKARIEALLRSTFEAFVDVVTKCE
jgi:hypothetical protein